MSQSINTPSLECVGVVGLKKPSGWEVHVDTDEEIQYS